jgi:hypothetical protein
MHTLNDFQVKDFSGAAQDFWGTLNADSHDLTPISAVS